MIATSEARLHELARRAGLGDIAEKILARTRLTLDDGLRLYRADLHAVGALANHVRERLHGDLAYFNVTNTSTTRTSATSCAASAPSSACPARPARTG
jgi:aminodeoxyfutalosine synthase